MSDSCFRHIPLTSVHFSAPLSFQECPSGVVNEETFKQIYSQFFPHGGEDWVSPLLLCRLISVYSLPLLSVAPDASTYAHYLFNAFDTGHTGSIKFEVWVIPFHSSGWLSPCEGVSPLCGFTVCDFIFVSVFPRTLLQLYPSS